MGLTEQIAENTKKAMKQRASDPNAEVALIALRMLSSDLKYRKIEKKEELTDNDIIDAINSMIKKRRESAKMYTDGDRLELAAKEMQEIEALQVFLPTQLSDEALTTAVDEAIKNTGAATMKDMGKVMGLLSGKLKGQAEPSRISAIVKTKLA